VNVKILKHFLFTYISSDSEVIPRDTILTQRSFPVTPFWLRGHSSWHLSWGVTPTPRSGTRLRTPGPEPASRGCLAGWRGASMSTTQSFLFLFYHHHQHNHPTPPPTHPPPPTTNHHNQCDDYIKDKHNIINNNNNNKLNG